MEMRRRATSGVTSYVQVSGLALALVIAIGLVGCAGSASVNGGRAGRDEAARCERDRGVWRPEIAGGYCEHKP
jgi:hypothetical protein